ncbi:MAG TPA: acetoacetate--CoA ligase [Geminicoccus sp.]|jgi:acetoacetyl-CoA synthetase|uniref:acetoacetate--CoA ligase n=1 Tax=Geminicoccus sp. TaxID=2024832 RepID=UPI002E367513|nr:acetoacetate--CoA ligase [Geminicoccus sp.]HEX2525519.1 acetoacetate--CoA ligase [Geminicoccus sp.]
MSAVLFAPSSERIAASNWTAFAAGWREREPGLPDEPHAFWRHTVEHAPAFWQELRRFASVIDEGEPEPALVGDRMPGAAWFPNLRLSFAENLLRRADDGIALIGHDERGRRRDVTFAELNRQTAGLATFFGTVGVEVGDRVAGLLPNVPEAIIGLLAANARGAFWSSCSPDFGLQGVLDRFGQIEPTVLLTVDGYQYGGKRFDIRSKLAEIVAALPSLRAVIVVPFLDEAPDLASIPYAVSYHEAIQDGPERPAFRRLPFEHPLLVLYSSGTTGKPKAIVHGQGGTLFQHLKEHLLHGDLKPGDRLFYFTTTSWMMWNWLVSGLAVGATLVLWEGSPFHPDGNVLWRIAAEERFTQFGTSAKYIDACKKAGVRPADFDLSALRTLFSTGSPLLPESFTWIYQAVKQDLQVASISGGTDIVSCFVLGYPTLPVRTGEIQGPGLGLAVDVWNDDGHPVRGEKGELVCTKPFPCMPVSFWNDPDGSRYRAAYFERFPGVWHHGDYAEITESGGFVIHGRSDAVLNPGGVRIGTAEIYRQVEQVEEVLEAICVGQDWEGDVRVVLFVRLRPGIVLDEELRARIRKQVRDNATPRHVPAKIVQVADIPRTMSGKITEIAVRDIIHGRTVKNTEALANPRALDLYRDLDELRR